MKIAMSVFGPWLRTFIWAVCLVVALSGQLLKAQTSSQNAPPSHGSSGVGPSLNPTGVQSHQPDAQVLHESWFFYLSSIAIVITAGSTLLVALAVIKMQSIAVALTTIERSLAESFHRIDKLDEYLHQTSEHSINEQWQAFFDAVNTLSARHSAVFPLRGRYNETQAHVTALIKQGRRLEQRNHELHSKMPPVFVATAIVAGLALLGLPAAQWINQNVLIGTWIVSGVCCLVLLTLFLKVLKIAFTNK